MSGRGIGATAGHGGSWPTLREAQRIILLDVLVHGTRSRADLARRSGLSRASLSRLTKELGDAGLVRETAAAPAEGRGRPSEMIAIVPEAAAFLGFKLTGDSLYAAVMDLAGRVLHAEGEPLGTREVGDVVALLARTAGRLRLRFPRVAAIGVCLAGDVRHDPGGGSVVVGSAFLGWHEVPLEALVAEASGLPVSVANDVQALTTAHHWFGAGVGASSLAVIGLGAGIGCGLVVGDERVAGAKGHPGKVGHLPVGGDATCDAGHTGCASAYVTIPAVLRNSGHARFWDALEAADAGDERAASAVTAAADALGAVVAALVNIVDPERIVVTGEGLAVAERRPDALAESVARRLDPASEVPRLTLHPFAFTDYAWGAAATALRELV